MMCAEQHKLLHHHHHHQLLFKKNSIRDIDIPPRKLLTRRPAASDVSDEALLLKFLPYNNAVAADDDDDYGADPYSSDHFRMYEFKVRRCTRSRSHDWTDCPFAHPGEKARRRDPRRYHYSGTVCPDFRRGSCARGDNCEFAHGVFECWLHPARYRTEPCKDGTNCKRKVCFFAHSPRQLRILPTDSPTASAAEEERKFLSPNSHCCVYCHSVSASPTSTLMSMSHFSPPVSPSLSPPLSPANNRSGFSPVSRFGDRLNSGGLSYKEALTELMSSLEGMNVNEASSSPGAGGGGGVNRRNLAWVDVSFAEGDEQQQQQQFVLSPSTPSPSGSSKQFLHFGDQFSSKGFNIADHKANDSSNLACPDFGWVNDLLT